MVIFGTAGHIDHGKTTVIYALTGIDADRLPEEKARGMTIDLGFAWLETAQNEKIGIIDVPGHEHFIRNMITGITSVDAFLLVVDAKEGWKPQTEEHFQIIRLLDINYGLIVITKTDLVSPEQVKKVEQEIQEKTNCLNHFKIPILHFSSKDNESVIKLKQQMQQVSKSIPLKRDIGKPRVFIDRVFEIKGSGTVVTGTLLNGNLYQNQSVYLFPSLKKVRVRQVQCYNISVEEAILGSRVALNLSGVKKEEIKRGDLIYSPQKLPFGNIFDIYLKLLSTRKTFCLTNGTEVEFITHTKILRGKIIFKQKELKPEEQTFAQIRFKEPLCLMIGDYYILRLPGINETIGGGRILDAQAIKHSFYNPLWNNWLGKRVKLDINQLIITELERCQKIKKDQLLLNSPYSQEEIFQHLDQLAKENILFLIADWVIDFHFWQNITNQILSFLEEKHRNHPLKQGFPITEFRNKFTNIPEDLFLSILHYCSGKNKIKIEKGMISAPQYSVELSDQQNRIVEDILLYIEKDVHHLPTEGELKEVFSNNIELIEYLIEEGEIILLPDQICITPSVFQQMKDTIVNFLRKNNYITINQVRELLHISRKYIVPLLSKLDEEGITIRRGNERVLK